LYKKILVVDDSPLLHKMYDLVLRKYRDRAASVVHAMNAREGLDALAGDADVDLVLLDINMPVMNGLEFLEQLGNISRHLPLTVVVVSTEGSQEDAMRALQMGASGYVTKPFRAADLYQAIESASHAQ